MFIGHLHRAMVMPWQLLFIHMELATQSKLAQVRVEKVSAGDDSMTSCVQMDGMERRFRRQWNCSILFKWFRFQCCLTKFYPSEHISF